MTQLSKCSDFCAAMSFYKSWESAASSASDFAQRLGDLASTVPLVIEVDLERASLLDGGTALEVVLKQLTQQGWKQVLAWTRDTTSFVRENWPSDLVNPFDPEFSYGGISVKVQALGRIAGCAYVVRFDPGCSAPENLMTAVSRHIGRIESGEVDVVAGVYDGRFAIRTDFLPQKPQELHQQRREELFRLVERFTRVVPEAQIVGGALYTCRTQCPPPPPLGDKERVAVVLSDDGFMKTVLGNRALVDQDTVVSRSEPGFSLLSHDYRVRLSMMAALDQLWLGASVQIAIEAAVEFYEHMGKLVENRTDVDVAAAKTSMQRQIDSLARCVERYRSVRSRWSECLDVVADLAEKGLRKSVSV